MQNQLLNNKKTGTKNFQSGDSIKIEAVGTIVERMPLFQDYCKVSINGIIFTLPSKMLTRTKRPNGGHGSEGNC